VSVIEIDYSLGDGRAVPWIHLCFDTAPEGEHEGGHYSHPDFAKLPRQGWLPAVQTVLSERKTGLVTTNGTKSAVGATLNRDIGDFLVSCLLSARKDGVFKSLPRAERCQLGVEDQTGEFGWPRYEDRGKKNLV
jgi:hypothetical protein